MPKAVHALVNSRPPMPTQANFIFLSGLLGESDMKIGGDFLGRGRISAEEGILKMAKIHYM